MKNKIIWLAAALLILALTTVAGCGSSQDEATTEAWEMPAPMADAADSAPEPEAPAAHFYDMDMAEVWAAEAVEEASPQAEPEPVTSAYGYAGYGEAPQPDLGPATQQVTGNLTLSMMQRMIIRSSEMAINTLNYDDTIARVAVVVANRGGFIETSRQWRVFHPEYDQWLWQAEYVLRVPVGLFDTTNQDLMALGQVRYFSTQSQDATREFNDLATRLVIREAELTRVEQQLYEATTLEEILRLESTLTTLRLNIDAYRRRREEIDHLAAFSTISLTVFNVLELAEDDYVWYEAEIPPPPPEDGFGSSLGRAFSASANATLQALEIAAIFIATIILPASLFGTLAFGAYVLIKKATDRRWLNRNNH